MKNILILGATGTFGTALTKKLQNIEGYHLTLFSCHEKSTYSDAENIKCIEGDATKLDDLREAIKNQDVIYCTISGELLPDIAKNLVLLMVELSISRILFMGAVGIYNEIPNDMDGEDNLENNSEQVPNRKAVDVIENSGLNYTVLRPGYLQTGSEDDYVLTTKGQAAKGYISTVASVVNLGIQLIADDSLYSRESISITRDMTK